MQARRLILILILVMMAVGGNAGLAAPARTPNIVYILADDLGYGDVRCFNAAGKIATPHLDRLAGSGLKFTDAHSGSAVCTPTRYGIMTGRYSWRSRLKSGVLNGYSPRLIEPGRLTVPGYLHAHGYATAALGKWHLGMDWTPHDPKKGQARANDANVDFAATIANGPTTLGFDRWTGISASLDMPPYVWIDGDRVRTVPTVEKTWIRKGPASADFEAIDVLPGLAQAATAWLEANAAAARDGKPIFLYLPLTAPHTPLEPTAAWQGRSGLNAYGDFVMQVDDVVGQVLGAIDRVGLAENTLVVFASDNGCAPMVNLDELRAKGHDPSAGFRGAKADIFEGGHRIPLIARWPGVVAPGSTSAQTVCLVDLFATVAAIVGDPLPPTAAEDSVSLLPVLQGTATEPVREATVHHSNNGSFAIRQGQWKLAFCPDSGGWSAPRPGRDDTRKLPLVQLYDLAADPAERHNRQADQPEVVARLTALMTRYVADGRSTPGPAQPNNGPPIQIQQPHKPGNNPGS